VTGGGGASLRARAALLLLAAALGACTARPTLDARVAITEDTRGSETVRARLAAAPPLLPRPLGIVATTATATPEVVRIALAPAPNVRWRRSLAADARPELLDDVVLVPVAGTLLVLDDESGETRHELPLPGRVFLGAAREGDTIAVAVRDAGDDDAPRTHLIAFDARTFAVRFRHDSDAELGRPVARAGMLFLPWQRQGAVVLDLASGRELAFLRSRDDVIDFVVADDDDVWLGQRVLYPLSRGYDGTRATARSLGPEAESLPGRPPLYESSFSPRPAVPSAHGRIALHLRARRGEGGGDPTARDDRAYFVFYRHVFAYDGKGALHWARSLPRDTVAARALGGGLLLIGDDGTITALAATDGAVLTSASVGAALGGTLASAALDGTVDLALPAGTAPAAPATSLRQGLLEIALDVDQRLLPARALAVSALAALPDPQTTRDLLDVYGRSTTPPELSRVVADALRSRRIGLEHAIDALLARYDFLDGTRPAPLAVLAPALVDAGERRAVPRLIERMLDHETPLGVLPGVVHAVVELGDAAVVSPLLAFLRLYRNDSSFANEPDALIEAARGVLRHGGAEGPLQLAAVHADGRAHVALRSAVAAMLAPSKPEAEPTAVTTAPAPTAPLPRTLSRADVAATFRAHEAELRACLRAELEKNPKLAQLRIAFVAESDGSAHAFQITPASDTLGDCLYPKLAGYRFPRFAAGRRVVRHTLALERDAEPTAPLQVMSDVDQPWWSRAAKTQRKVDPMLTPWWQSAHPIAPLVTRDSSPGTSAPSPTPSSTPAPTAAPASSPEDAWWVPAGPKP
jgi:hypothetical protein